jgi:chromosomal replication initiation ATPase DnaA
MTDRITELRTMPYDQYLLTPEWQERRKQALLRAQYRCQVCNSTERLHVHHRTYERRGAEEAGDLTVLCRDCHELYHFPSKRPVSTLVDDEQQKQRALSRVISQYATFATFVSRVPNVRYAYRQARQFATHPTGWLALLGPSGCGKTHLAGAIANQRRADGDVVIVVVNALPCEQLLPSNMSSCPEE